MLRRLLILTVALSCACGSKPAPSDEQPTETAKPADDLERKLEALRDRARHSLAELEVEVERATSSTDAANEAVERPVNAALLDLKTRLDTLNNDIENLVANSDQELQKAEKQIEERLEVLNKKSRELLKRKSKATTDADADAPEGDAPADAADEAPPTE